MGVRPPRFLCGTLDGVPFDSVDETSGFCEALPIDGSITLAWLVALMQEENPYALSEPDRLAAQDPRLCCRQVGGWAVFYAVAADPVDVAVLLAAPMEGVPFDTLARQARARLALDT
jgi:hypothetical protein